MEQLCDLALYELIAIIKPQYIVGIGRYAEDRCRDVVGKNCLSLDVSYLRHPSPFSVPYGYEDVWEKDAIESFRRQGMLHLMQTT